MIKKIITIHTSIVTLLFVGVVPVFAHVIVHPSQVGIAAIQEFSMSVPTEKDNPTVGIKLLIPDGLQMVSPNVKPGWTINVVRNGSGEDAKVTEIDWTGGSIPPEQRDDFLFQAQVPAQETSLHWKAYQTYSDGSVVAWDHDPKLSKGADDDSAPPPYSQTKVVNDLTGNQMVQGNAKQVLPASMDKKQTFLIELAFVLSIVAISIALRGQKKK